MATISNFALRLPPSLMEDVKVLATRDAVSVNQFLVQAVAEKVATLKARGYLAERVARAVEGDLGRILAKAGMPTSIPGDELPEGWPDASVGASSQASLQEGAGSGNDKRVDQRRGVSGPGPG